jgi:hypothetical protein
MAKKKPDARQREIAQLAKSYQANLSQIEPQYKSAYDKKTKAISDFNVQTAAYESKLADYNTLLANIAKDPVVAKTGKQVAYKPWLEPTTGIISYYPVEETYTYYEPKPIPKFTEKAPAAPDTSAADTEIEGVKARQKSLEESFQRELGERKASKAAAVSQRARSRPMLAKGVTLNG